MCGIVGYVGKQQAAPILLDGLQRLEYRGYDSAGIAVSGPEGMQVKKAKGRLQVLKAGSREARDAFFELLACAGVRDDLGHAGDIVRIVGLADEAAEGGCGGGIGGIGMLEREREEDGALAFA